MEKNNLELGPTFHLSTYRYTYTGRKRIRHSVYIYTSTQTHIWEKVILPKLLGLVLVLVLILVWLSNHTANPPWNLRTHTSGEQNVSFSARHFLSFLESDPGERDFSRSGVESLLTGEHQVKMTAIK